MSKHFHFSLFFQTCLNIRSPTDLVDKENDSMTKIKLMLINKKIIYNTWSGLS